MEYSFPYIVVLVFFALCAFLFEISEDQKKKQHITLISISVFYIFFAFRGYINTDWTSYAQRLDTVEWEDVFHITSEAHDALINEPGFTLLCLLCKSIINEYAFLVIVITTIDLALFLRFLKKFNIENVAFALMLFVTFRGTSMMFNLMRNQIAIFIFLNALVYLRDRKPLPYFGLCTLALCFHSSSVVYFPLYFFLHRKCNRWLFLGLFCSFFVFYLSHISIVMTMLKILGLEGSMGGKAEFYTEHFTTSLAFSPTGTLEKFGIVLLAFAFYNKIIEKYNGAQIIFNSLLIFMFFYYVFNEFAELSNRLYTLFYFAYWIVCSYILNIFSIQNNKRLYFGLLFTYCVYVTMLAYPQPVQEYDNLLFGGKSQTERMKIFNKTFEADN